MYKIELPAYVNTFFHAFCEECKYCELEFSEEQYNGNVAYTMTCKHLNLCARVEAKVLAEKYGEQEVLCWYERADESMEWVNIGLKPSKPKSVWDLKSKDECWTLDETGGITHEKYGDGFFNDERRKFGNVFLTEKETLQEKERREVETLLLKHGGRRWFRRNRYNYYMWLNTYGSLIISSTSNMVQGVIYFDTMEQTQKAIDEIGEKRIKESLFEAR